MTTAIKNDYLKIGHDHAPVKLEAFMNVACKGSASFQRVAKQVLPEYIENGKLQIILKLYDKPREELILGPVVHWSLDYTNPEQAIHVVTDLLDQHPAWMDLSNLEMKEKIVKDYGLSPEERLENVDVSLAFTKEAIDRHITIVPTFFFNGENSLKFSYDLTPEDVRNAVETALSKVNA